MQFHFKKTCQVFVNTKKNIKLSFFGHNYIYFLYNCNFFLVFVEASYKVGQWVIVIFKKEWYVREVCSVEDDMIQVKCMKRIGGNLNKFAWPDKDDISWFTPTEILCNVDPPVPVTSRAFALFQGNTDFINSCLEI